MKRITFSLFVLMTIFVSITIAYAATIHVPGDQPTIQAGIDAAKDGDTVLVADGTYTGDGNRDIDFNGKAIILQSQNGAENCTIDCGGTEDNPHRGFSFHSGETDSSVVNGFTIQNGYAPLELLFGGYRSVGGGIYCYQSSPSIKNNIIYNNRTRETGAVENGGGIYCYECSPIIQENIIKSNQAILGGGIYLYQSSTSIKNNLIVDNSAWESGGGIYCNDSSTIVINNTIVDNSAVVYGNGIYSYYFPLTITNSIIWGNDIYLTESSLDISYSCVQNGINGIGKHSAEQITYQDNIDAKPLFVDVDNDNYYLQSESPCLSSANCDDAPDTDKDGRNRPLGSGCDMGCYEQYDDGSLAVTLSTFTATVSGNVISLQWRTESEIGNIGFNIYRSDTEEGKYKKIGFVNGAGSSAMPNDYQFTDNEVEPGNYYYYIEDIDISGEKNKSKVIEVFVPTKPVVIIPQQTVLMQNYPNPFNPETWIPFKLSDDTNVVISIYDIQGQLVRKIGLGNTPAGMYVSKDQAAYWDGKNSFGEKVSSGLYFYTIQAGEYRATKRMMIVK